MEGAPYQPVRPRRGAGKVIAVAVVIIIIIVLIASPWFWAVVNNITKPSYQYDASADIAVTRTMSITAGGIHSIDISLDVPLPKEIKDAEGSVVQAVNSVDPSPTPLDEFKYGWHWMTWDKSSVNDYSVTIVYSFHEKTVLWDVSDSTSADINAIPTSVVQTYGGDEWKILPSEPQIVSLASDLTRMEDTVYGKLKAIFDYMTANIEYRTTSISEPKDCLVTLSDRWGDCDDQSILFCSLARAAGIPAWMEFGALYDPNSGAWGGHAWIKAQIPLIDGTGGAVNIDVVNKQFRLRSCNRFTDWESDGNGTHMKDYYDTLVYRSMGPAKVTYSEDYTGSYTPSKQKIIVTSDGKQATPAIEPLVIVATVASIAVVSKKFYEAR